MLESKNDNNDHDENYDEFDLLHDMKDRSIRRKRTTSESGPRYLRSLSENTPQTPLGGMVFFLIYFFIMAWQVDDQSHSLLFNNN